MSVMASSCLPPIASGFVRKLYSILNGHHAAIIDWNETGTAFTVFDIELLVERVLPLYFRGRLDAFRQQLREHSFHQIVPSAEGVVLRSPASETYRHAHFLRGNPTALSKIARTPLPRKRTRRKKPTTVVAMKVETTKTESISATADDLVLVKTEPLPLATTATVVPGVDELKNAGNSTNPLFTDDERFDILQWLVLPAVDAQPSLSSNLDSTEELELLLADGEYDDDAQAEAAMDTAGHLTDDQIDVFMRLLAAPSADGDAMLGRRTVTPSATMWDAGNQFSEDTLHSMVEWFSTVPTT